MDEKNKEYQYLINKLSNNKFKKRAIFRMIIGVILQIITSVLAYFLIHWSAPFIMFFYVFGINIEKHYYKKYKQLK